MRSVIIKTFDAPSVDLNETLGYMRAGKEPSQEVVSLAEEGIRKIIQAAECKVCYIRLPLVSLGEGMLLMGDLAVQSESLEERLYGCSEVYLFAATAGHGADRVISATALSSAALSLACDSAGSALVEKLCDKLCAELDDGIRGEGRTTVTRFSAGYGDFSIGYQTDISKILNTSKNIGASLTDGGMFSPTKTVTAVVGIKNAEI